MWLNLQHFSNLFISVKRKEKKITATPNDIRTETSSTHSVGFQKRFQAPALTKTSCGFLQECH